MAASSRFFQSIVVFFILSVLASHPTSARSFSVGGAINTAWTDNVFLMRDPEPDFSILPSARLSFDFAQFWSVQYDGSAEIFTSHTDLTSHDHALRVQANPVFGADGQHEFLVAATVQTLRNQTAYESLNFVGGQLKAAVSLEPMDYFAWQASADLRYRRFYDDPGADDVGGTASTQARFTLPTRTTITPRLAYAYRYNLGLEATDGSAVDRHDHQLDAGFHVSQGIADRTGLQADYVYRHPFETSQALLRKLTQSRFALLNLDFLMGGHRAYLKLKQLLPEGFSILAGIEFRTLEFKGWPALDADGALTGADRTDRRLNPSLTVSWARPVGSVRLDASLTYSFMKQWSNSADYDTRAHWVGCTVGVDY